MREKLLYVLGAAAVVLLARNLNVMARLPHEVSQGAIFKNIFFHVPTGVAAIIAAAVALVTSVLFLVTRNFKFDAVAVAVTEVGLVFLAIHLLTGALWSRIVWGIWWTWDARLTSALVCWLVYAAYLMLRRAVEEPTQRATFAAIWSIFSFIDVPIVILSIHWWRALHPLPALWGETALPAEWRALVVWNLAALTLVGAIMTIVRLRQEDAQRELDSLRRMVHVF